MYDRHARRMPSAFGAGSMFSVGDVIAGDFEIRGVLGSGGMGQVFDAHDRALDRRVAIKAHWPHLVAFPIRREARALAAIHHPAVVTVYGVAHHTWDGREMDLLVMERILGVSLDQFLARRDAGHAISVADALDILTSLADGLAAVHAAGIAHRDVKPANIMLAPKNRVVLTDFGIFLAEIEVNEVPVRTGTPEYMAPEAIAGAVVRGGGHLADVYAFGVVAFELLTGRRPFLAKTVDAMLEKHLGARAPAIRSLRAEVPTRLADIIDGALQKDPSQRPETMESVASCLRGITEDVLPRPIVILIAEHDPEVAEVLGHFVSGLVPEATVRLACDGDAVLAHVRQATPDLLLLDLGLPSMNGIELCMYLRGAGLAPHMRIVTLSGAAAQAPDFALLRRLGIATVIRKGSGCLERVEAIVRETRDSAAPSGRPSHVSARQDEARSSHL